MPDIMGCQECDDISRVLHDGNLASAYTAIRGPHSLAMAYKTDDWDLVSEGFKDIAVDEKEQFYGHRSAQWARLQHRQSGKLLLVVNHHGPLPMDSGGACGGKVTAFNLLRVVEDSAEDGDVVVLVGDFNAGQGSDTVTGLSGALHKCASGAALGGLLLALGLLLLAP